MENKIKNITLKSLKILKSLLKIKNKIILNIAKNSVTAIPTINVAGIMNKKILR